MTRTRFYAVKIGRPKAKTIARLLIQWRWWLLGIAVLTGAGAYGLSQRLDFDRSIESMFSPRDPLLKPYLELKRNFAGNEIVLAVYEDANLFDQDGTGIQRLTEVAQQLKGVHGVRDILSLAEVNQALERLSGLATFLGRERIPYPIVDPTNDLAQKYLDIFEGYTHGADGQTVSIVCLLDPDKADTQSRRKTISSLRKIMSQQRGGNVTGEPVLVSDGFDFVERDGERLGFSSILLLALVIVCCFQSLRWVLIPIAVVYWSLWMSRAILVLLGLQMSMVSSMLAAIVTVIGVATIIHLIVRFREARHDQLSKQDSIQRAFALLLVPIFWACITDAVGFSALLFAGTGPVRDFGLMMAIASLCVLAGIVLIVPGLSLLGSSSADPQDVWGETTLKDALQASTDFIRRHTKIIAFCIFVVFVVVGSGIFRLTVETDFTKNFKRGSQIAEAYEFVEQRIGGAGVLDVIVPAPKLLSTSYLERVEALQADLRAIVRTTTSDGENETSTQPALTKVVSLADLDRAARSLRVVPTPELRYAGMVQVMPTFANAMRYINKDRSQPDYLRIMLRTSQQGTSEQQQQLIQQITEIAEQHFPETEESPAAQTTGIFVLLANLVDRLLADQFLTFSIANIFIFSVMVLALKSWKLALIAMVPNIVPILMLLGLLGWLDIKLNMGAVMIAAVSIGLSIDSSIHYLWSYKRCRRTGMSVFESIQQSQQRVGRAASYSTLALVAGFSTLCFSQFVPTIYFGGLVSLSMLGGLLGNLVLLPVLLLLTFNESAPANRSLST